MYLTALKMIALSSILIISGCVSTKPSPVEIRTVEIKVPITHPSLPRAIDLKEPYWYVVSDKNIEDFIENTKNQNNGGIIFVAMSVSDYELMAFNMQELKRYISQLKEVVVYYRTMNTE